MVTPGFNLASRDYRRERRRHLLGVGVAACLLALLAVQLGLWATLRQGDTAIADRLESMERELRLRQDEVRTIRAGLAADAVTQYEAKVAALNEILEAAAFSWSGLLLELERSIPPGVTLAEIQPDVRSGRVALRGSAKSFADLGKLLRGLEQRTSFTDVFLLRQAVKRSPGGGPEVLEFSVTLTYRGHES